MVIIRPRAGFRYNQEAPKVIVAANTPSSIITGIRALKNGRTVAVTNEFTLIRFFSFLENTQIPISIENEHGIVLEHRWPTLDFLDNYIQSHNATEEVLEAVMGMKYVLEQHKITLAQKYGHPLEDYEEEEDSNLEDEFEVRKPVEDKLSSVGKAVDALFND